VGSVSKSGRNAASSLHPWRVPGFDTLGGEPAVDVGRVEPDVLADLVERDPPLIDEATDESLRSPEPLGGASDVEQSRGRLRRSLRCSRPSARRRRHDLFVSLGFERQLVSGGDALCRLRSVIGRSLR